MSELTPDERAELRDLQRRLFGGENRLEAREADRYRQLAGRHADPREVGVPAVSREQVNASEQRQTAPTRSLVDGTVVSAKPHPPADAVSTTTTHDEMRMAPAWLQRMRDVPLRRRVESVIAGAGLAYGVVGIGLGIQSLGDPRPIYTGHAKTVDAADLPPGFTESWGEDFGVVNRFDGWDHPLWIFEVAGVGEYSCLVFEVREVSEAPQFYCDDGPGATVFDIAIGFDQTRGLAEQNMENLSVHRVILQDDVLTIWDSPPTSKDAY